MGQTEKFQWLAGSLFVLTGCILFLLPDYVFGWILDVSILYFAFNTVFLLYSFFRTKKKSELLYAACSLVFVVILTRHTMLPEWVIRVTFGMYCLLSAAATYIQLFIDIANEVPGRRIFNFLISSAYLGLGLSLLFVPEFNTDWLMRFFGLYFIVLGFRFFINGVEMHDTSKKYQWKRRIRIMLPPVISALIPDWVLSDINGHIQRGMTPLLLSAKNDEKPRLKVMVFVGPEGFQKIGHISFAWDGIVYSYGNYDSDSFRLNGTLGDGVFFNVALEDYIPNMMEMENNSIFEYGISTTPAQNKAIEEALRQLHNTSYRWYTRIERQDGYDAYGPFLADYPSRLHLRTGAKMYKFKKGKFKTYWALGDNCALFTDIVLGKLGADVLSMRGIISPGSYLDFLDTEYLRTGSPVISRHVYAKADKEI